MSFSFLKRRFFCSPWQLSSVGSRLLEWLNLDSVLVKQMVSVVFIMVNKMWSGIKGSLKRPQFLFLISYSQRSLIEFCLISGLLLSQVLTLHLPVIVLPVSSWVTLYLSVKKIHPLLLSLSLFSGSQLIINNRI